MLTAVASETGWSFNALLWEVPASALMQIYDVVCIRKGATLRWLEDDLVDLQALSQWGRQ